MPGHATRTKPDQRRIVTPEVLASERISPNFVRVTVGGPELAAFAPMGHDQWFRLFLPGPDGLRLPTTTNNVVALAQFLMMSKQTRPLLRNYTVRDHRAAGAGRFGDTDEVDIDFVAHGDGGAASAWAEAVAPGTRIGLLDEGITYRLPYDYDWTLLAGDESALPAIAGVLRSAPRTLRGAAFLEIPHPDDRQELGEPAGVEVTWLPRTGHNTPIGALATEAVRAARLPAAGVYAFIAGEQKLATGIRRHLVNDRGIPKADINFAGYWRLGKAHP
ncbi:siderophore-interacting protein [Nocardia sp. NPDC057272]|uniref:siderophore-interacting protein n=1 Tax=Nocardia sp. NPDC057272 TaxID=3346079 RepID=UPI0036398B80